MPGLDTPLSTASAIVCDHTRPPGTPPPPVPVVPPVGGGVLTVSGPATLRVAGVAVLTAEGTAAIAGCKPPPTPPPGFLVCAAPVRVTGGLATALRVDGSPVLLAGSFLATTAGAPPPAFTVRANQALLRAE